MRLLILCPCYECRYTFSTHSMTLWPPLRSQKMSATENADGTHSEVTYEFVSLDDDDHTGIALCTGCVRAKDLGSTWTFTSLDGGKKTKIEADIAVDYNMPHLTTFFVNLFQKRWPVSTIHGLMKTARHHLGRDGDVQVANTFFKLFPLFN